MYQFKKDVNNRTYWRFDKMLVKSKKWARLPSASKQVYPVIAIHADSLGSSFPSQETIAILSGCTENTVRKGVKGLMGFHGFRIENRLTSRGYRAKRYKLKITPEQRGATFPLYRSVVDGGNWSLLTPSEKALFPVVKALSYFDYDFYLELLPEEDAYELPDATDFFEDHFTNRKFDILSAPNDVLAEFAGIGKRTVPNALIDLQDKNLIERTNYVDGDHRVWKVFRVPSMIYKRDWLNKKIKERYGATAEKKYFGRLRKLPTKNVIPDSSVKPFMEPLAKSLPETYDDGLPW